MLRVGDACDAAADACEPYATCFGGVCRIVGFTAGDPCNDQHPCGQALYCAEDRCKAKSTDGEACDPKFDSCIDSYCDARFFACQQLDYSDCASK
jgi:hypothetical protein